MTDKKIEYGEWEHGFSKLIEECSDGYVFDHDVWRDELYAYIHNNYTPNTEVQKAVEEAVRGFVREFSNKCLHDSINESYNYYLEEIPNIVSDFVEQYLESEGKE